MRIPVPDDATYDYIPTPGPQVQVGDDLLSLWTVQGEVSAINHVPNNPGNPDEVWSFLLSSQNPDGSEAFGFAFFAETPANMPDQWWGRFAIWKRAAKPDDGSKLTAADGSKWIYPASSDGQMYCYETGSTYQQGWRRFRGQLTTEPFDLWICDDADWDWIPVADGGEIAEGDVITFLTAKSGVVDSIVTTDYDFYTQTGFLTSTPSEIGWYYVLRDVLPAILLNVWTFFVRLPKPDLEDVFSAPDGSRWIYTDPYQCWGGGTIYPSGALSTRGDITGGLTPSPS